MSNAAKGWWRFSSLASLGAFSLPNRLRRSSVCQRFLILFTVRCLKKGRNSVHRDPSSSYFDISNRSSSSVHGEMFSSGHKYVLYRSRHWRAVRLGIWEATQTQSSGPSCSTMRRNRSSSCGSKMRRYLWESGEPSAEGQVRLWPFIGDNGLRRGDVPCDCSTGKSERETKRLDLK